MESKQDALLAAVMRASLDCIVVADEEGRVVDWNHAAERTFGIRRDEAVGHLVAELIIPAHLRDAHTGGMARYLGGGVPKVLNQRVEVEACRRDGSTLPVELAITEVDVSGERLFMASLRDLTELRRTTVALEESKAKLEAFFEHAPASMFIKARDGTYEAVNAYTGALMGRPAEAIVGRRAEEVFSRQTAEAAEAIDRAVLETGEAQILEQAYDVGQIKHTVTARFPIRAADGSISHIGVVIIDISDRVEAETRMRDSEARLKALLDHAPLTMYLKDRQGHYCIANRFMAEQLGRTSEELRSLTPDDILPPASAAEAKDVDRIIVETREPHIRESEFDTVEGVKSAVTVRFPVFDECGDIAYIGGIFLDTSEQRRAQRRFRALSEHHPVAMLIVRAEDQRILLANPAFFELIGIPTDSEVTKVSQNRWLEDPEEDRRFRELVRAHDRFDGYECRMLRAQGSFWCSISWRHIDFDGERAVVFSALNITAKKRAEDELERSRDALHQSEKMNALGSLLAGVSHELNNPLAVVVGEAILLEEDAEGSEFAASAARIRKSAERCSRIVQTFLAIARQRPPERVPLDVPDVVAAAVELTDYGMRSNGIEIVREIEPGLPKVAADSDQLHQVLVNLLINAQQALQEGPPPRRICIGVRYDRSSDLLCIDVADNGPGIPEDVARRIFDPFFTTKPQGAGTGIGLSFSHGVVEAHGGRLSLIPSDEGAHFLIELPVSAPATETPLEPSEPESLEANMGHALIVDDEPELAATLARFLGREGFECDVVNSGGDALELLVRRDYDVILSDLRMPGMDGPAILDWISRSRPDLVARVGFVTGDTLGPAAVRFLENAGRPYIEKPFRREGVRQLLSALVPPSGG